MIWWRANSRSARPSLPFSVTCAKYSDSRRARQPPIEREQRLHRGLVDRRDPGEAEDDGVGAGGLPLHLVAARPRCASG
jgi:hypothetical protein